MSSGNPIGLPSDQSPLLSEFIQAYQDYVAALRAAYLSKNPQQQATQAYEAYIQEMSNAYNTYMYTPREAPLKPPTEQMAKAYHRYLQGLHDAVSPEEVMQNAQTAYQEFMLATQKAWTLADVENFGVRELATLSRILSLAATLSMSTMTALQQWQMAARMVPSTNTTSV